MRTIGRHWNSRTKGDYTWHCDYCGFAWKRSALRKDGAGLYVCPQEGRGRDVVTLTELNQMRTPVITAESSSGKGNY
jgi:hypothetical protein